MDQNQNQDPNQTTILNGESAGQPGYQMPVDPQPGYQQQGYQQQNYYQPPQQGTYYPAAPADPNVYRGDARFKPLGAWAYFWLAVLFNIPVVGWVFLIVFSFMNSNINRRNFARSYFCGLLVVGIFFVIYLLLMVVLGASLFSYGYYY